MAAIKPIKLTKPLSGATLNVTVNVTRQFWLRTWLGIQFIKLAAIAWGVDEINIQRVIHF